MYTKVLDKIKEYDYITIFRHQRPDGDALFSASALKEFIRTNFKGKKVKLAGFDSYDKLPVLDKVSDKFVENSLAIILDVSQIDRTDDTRFLKAKERMIIDHHPGNPDFVETALIDTNTCATAELLTKILYSEPFKEYKLNNKTCKYLYSGILTDSNSFTTSNTTAETFYYAGKLIQDGQLKPSDIHESVFNENSDHFKKVSKLRNHLVIKNKVGYCILDENDLAEIGFSDNEAKNCVNEFSRIDELNVWAIYAYNAESKRYNGSIRSRRKYVINTLCNKYNGGGHKNACGVKGLSKSKVNAMLKDLSSIAN